MANHYIADLKPSINSDHTTWKIGEVFPDELKPILETLIHENDWCIPKETDIEFMPWQGIYWWDKDRHQSGHFCGRD